MVVLAQLWLHKKQPPKKFIPNNEALKPKPSPQPYLQAMGHFSSKPRQTVIFEDSRTGLTSAVKSKANVIGLTTSLNKKNIKEIDKNILVVDSYYNLKSGFNFS